MNASLTVLAGRGPGTHHDPVRRWLLNAPRRVLVLGMGVPFGLWTVLWSRFGPADASWAEAAGTGLLGGVFFGVSMGLVLHRQYRGVRGALGGLSEADLRRAGRASWRGPVPEDPAVRDAAHALTVNQLAQLRRQRVWALPFLALMLVVCLYLALAVSAWGWLVVAGWAVLASGHVLGPRLLRRRAELLGSAPER